MVGAPRWMVGAPRWMGEPIGLGQRAYSHLDHLVAVDAGGVELEVVQQHAGGGAVNGERAHDDEAHVEEHARAVLPV
eukprot:1195353-Prorocentrum_minimum.AAC.7